VNGSSARPLRAGACLALMAACSQARTGAPLPPVYDIDVAPILQAHCVECHGDTNPAAGWSATSFLGAIACVPSNVPATLPPSNEAPILAALATPPHVGLLGRAEQTTVASWVAGGTPAFRVDVHDPSIIDPRSAGFHGAILRASHWSQMLDPGDPNACGGCHDGAPTRPPGVTHGDPAAPSCTTCHYQPGGALACSTCHGSGVVDFPPRDPCFFPGDVGGGAHALHVDSSPEKSGGVPCSTCHPVPGSPVIGGLHGDGIVEVTFDPIAVPREASYDPTTGACAVSCHAQGGTKPDVTWTEAASPVTCQDCHLSPPAGHYSGPCNGCHAEANAAGTALNGGPLHLNGMVDLGNGSGLCGACHGTGASPWPTTAAHPAHQNPTLTVPLACSNCHVVPATILDPVHLDGTVHVTFSGLAVSRGAEPTWNGTQCTNVACHGANLADPPAVPAWSDTSGAQAQCGACHGIPPSEHTTATTCSRSDCHGSEVTLDENGAPLISASGKALHIDGIIESAR
jgi:predicted CxxxxCH...CXXCH cytochrome family protein